MQTITATIGTDKYQTTLTNSRQSIIADESTEHNGKDLGPNPHELLMMSLASCTAITLRMYADRKEWNISQIVVSIQLEKTAHATVFTRALNITGELNNDQRERMLAIANVCPVHKTLPQPIEINTRLV